MQKKKIRFGILGAAHVAPRALIEPSNKLENVEIVGVASRDIEKGLNFKKEHDIPTFTCNYDDLLNNPDIDAIYITLPNSYHTEYIIKAANAGKHILVEKPLCISSSDFELIRSVIKKNNVIILEALMMQHHPWQNKLKEIISSKIYGNLISSETVFNLTLTEKNKDSYRYYPNLGGGVFFDCAPYWLQFIQLFQELTPCEFTSFSRFDGPNRVDMEFNARMNFTSKFESTFSTSYLKPYLANHSIKLQNADIIIRTFTRPSFGDYALTIKVVKNDESFEQITFEPQNYYLNQLKFFIKVLNNEIPNIPLEESFERVKLLEDLYNYAKNSTR